MYENEKDPLIQVGALWRPEDKDSKVALAGSFGDARVIILKNNYKEADNHPDYKIFLTNRKRQNSEAPQVHEEEQDNLPF